MPRVTVGGTRLRVSPLWVRVDQNRTKLTIFVITFVAGSALLLDAALIAVPGSLLSLAFANDTGAWFEGLAVVVAAAFGVLLALGALLSAIQLSNAEHWVGSRFAGRELAPAEAPDLASAVADMAMAAGLAAPPRLMLIEGPAESINAFALGTTRSKPLIGVTPGFLTALTVDEQRAVIATLTARIVAGDIMFGTALAALMGPLKAIRESRKAAGGAAGTVADAGCSNPGCMHGAGDGCSGCADVGDLDDGCAGVIGFVVFMVVVAVITYIAVVCAAWIVTLWGRSLHRTSYEKADAEGMLLLKDPTPMLSALATASRNSNAVGDGDASYDGIFYVTTSGTPRVEKVEARRHRRLREVLGTEGLAAEDLLAGSSNSDAGKATPPEPPAAS